MHILLIHQAFVSPKDAEGTRHYELAGHCLQRGHAFTIVTSDLSYLTGQRATEKRGIVSEENLHGIRVLRAYTVPTLHRSFRWRVVSFLSFMFTSIWAGLSVKQVDLIIGTSPPIFQGVSAWIVACLRRKPFLLEIRDLWPEFAIEMGVLRNRFLIVASRWLETFLYNRAKHIVVNSPAYEEYLLTKGISRERITVIPNGVDPTQFDPECHGEEFKESLQLNGKFIATYAGALGLANDLATVLRAAERLKDHPGIQFLLVGDGKERPALQEMANRMGLTNVLFAGARSKSQMREVLGASTVCVATLQNIPMFRTTYPNKVFDYMASGRPTILAIDGVIRKVVEDANGGIFVPPGNDEALADAVLRLFRNQADCRRMGDSARAYVTRHFNRTTHAAGFIRLVERVSSGKAPSPELIEPEKTDSAPGWHALINAEDPDWCWSGQKLIHREALSHPFVPPKMSKFRSSLLRYVYATQNRSKAVRRSLDGLLRGLGPAEWGLNVGAGATRLHERVLNLDLFESEGINIVTRGYGLPFKNRSLALVISQEVLEHLGDPARALAEVHRVLRPGGHFFCQVPFVIGYHPGPHDFWRFTKEGLRQLFAPEQWRVRALEISLGHGSGFYRIAVEYVAVSFSILHAKLYMPAKASAALLLAPLKIPDLATHLSSEADRIPGGYFCIAEKI